MLDIRAIPDVTSLQWGYLQWLCQSLATFLGISFGLAHFIKFIQIGTGSSTE
jgi:hypothetical protein